MPLPEPKPNEEENEFVWRCQKELEETESEKFKTKDQRFAVCYKQWEKKNEVTKMNIIEKIDKYLNEQTEKLWDDKEGAQEVAKYIQKNIKAPVVKASVSSLGPLDTVMIDISLDKKEDWINNIFQNSRYLQVRFDSDPSKSNLEVFGKSHKIDAKFRKQKARSKEEAVKKLNNYIKKAS